jgi:nucleotide-binding universal stress UspA family protein
MFKHILLPTDGSELSNKAVRQAIEVARVHGAKITAVTVVRECHLYISEEGGRTVAEDVETLEKRLEAAEAARAKKILDEVQRFATEADVQCDTVAPISHVPYEAIIKQAEKSGCDLIVMASHGRRGLQALLLGSETVKVLTHSTIPVLVCR